MIPSEGETHSDGSAPHRPTKRGPLRILLAFSALVELGTGLALLVDSPMVIALLLGTNESRGAAAVGRVAGSALLALGLACWPSANRTEDALSPLRGMLVYNILISVYLAYLGTVRHFGGLLLWPAVVLHAGVALSMGWLWTNGERSKRNAE